MSDDGGWGSYAEPVQFANSIEEARELMADGGNHLYASTQAIQAKYAAMDKSGGVTMVCGNKKTLRHEETWNDHARGWYLLGELCNEREAQEKLLKYNPNHVVAQMVPGNTWKPKTYGDPVGLWFSRVMLLALVAFIVFILAITGILR